MKNVTKILLAVLICTTLLGCEESLTGIHTLGEWGAENSGPVYLGKDYSTYHYYGCTGMSTSAWLTRYSSIAEARKKGLKAHSGGCKDKDGNRLP